jgi:hypothetical protein
MGARGMDGQMRLADTVWIRDGQQTAVGAGQPPEHLRHALFSRTGFPASAQAAAQAGAVTLDDPVTAAAQRNRS